MVNERSSGQIRAFAHLTAEKAGIYRDVMRVFTDAKARFSLHLRPEEVAEALRLRGRSCFSAETTAFDDRHVEAVLNQLCEWGNLSSHADTTDVTTVEEFYRPRYLFQITREGEAAELALSTYEKALRERVAGRGSFRYS